MGVEQADPKIVFTFIALDPDEELIIGFRRASLVLLDVARHARSMNEQDSNGDEAVQTPHQASASLAASSGVRSA
jgi:hypothetical protein